MIKHLLDQIMSPDSELKTEVNICRSSHFSKFVKVSTYLSTEVARLYPYANGSSGCFGKLTIYATARGDRGSGRSVSFNGRVRGRGRGGRSGQVRVGHSRGGFGGGTGVSENGIDISDFNRYFEDLEWAALSKGKISLRIRYAQSSW